MSNTNNWIAAILGVLAVVAAIVWWTQFRDPAGTDPASLVIDAGDAALVAEGKAVYADACAACHGAALEGEPDWRIRKPDGTLPAPPHDVSGHTWHHADGLLFAITKYGGNYVTQGNPPSGMPGFEATLTDRQIIASLAYIKSTWPDEIRQRQAEMTRRSLR